MRVQIEGPHAATVAAALEAHFETAGLTHQRLEGRIVNTRSLDGALIAIAIALPGAINHALQLRDRARRQVTMKDKLAQQAEVDALKARIAELEAQYPGTAVTPVADEGELWLINDWSVVHLSAHGRDDALQLAFENPHAH